MKKIYNLLFIFALVLVGGLIGLGKVNADSTVLYNDNTLIINEKDEDRASNIIEHGDVEKEYVPFSNKNNYVFASKDDVLWKNDRIDRVLIGSKIKPTSTSYWFYWKNFLRYGDFTNLDTSNVTDMSYMFFNSGSEYGFELKGLSSWDTSKVTTMKNMFYGVSVGTNSSWDIGDISNWNTSKVADMSGMFYHAIDNGGNQSFELDLSKWDVSNVTDMSYMFNGAGQQVKKFSIGNLSKWNVSKVTDMSYMFTVSGASASTWNIGDISNWNVSNVRNMSHMFDSAGHQAKTWTMGNLSKWNVSKVTDMSYMFDSTGGENTYSTLDLSKWNTSEVRNMKGMFKDAGDRVGRLIIGDLSKWNVSKVTDMSYMFYNFAHWTTLNSWNIGDLSKWNTSNVVTMESMFSNLSDYDDQYTTKKIGSLNIYSGVNVKNFAADSPTFSGNIILHDYIVNYNEDKGIFYNATTSDKAKVKIYYMTDYSENIANQIVGLFGINGSKSQGNITAIKLVNISSAKITGIFDKTYNEKVQTQNITIKYDGKTLKNETDYTVSYKNNKNAGTATMIITGQGNYYGTINKTFKITKAKNPIKVIAKNKKVKYKKLKKKKQVITSLKVTKAQGKVTYAKVSGNKRFKINKTTGKITVKKKTKKGTYYLKFKVTASGNNNYKAASKTVTVKFKIK